MVTANRYHNPASERAEREPGPSRTGELGQQALDIVRDLVAEVNSREAHLRSILETVPDAMVIIDEGGLIQSFSATAERLFGFTAGEIQGRNVSLLMPMPYRQEHDGYLGDTLRLANAASSAPRGWWWASARTAAPFRWSYSSARSCSKASDSLSALYAISPSDTIGNAACTKCNRNSSTSPA